MLKMNYELFLRQCVDGAYIGISDSRRAIEIASSVIANQYITPPTDTGITRYAVWSFACLYHVSPPLMIVVQKIVPKWLKSQGEEGEVNPFKQKVGGVGTNRDVLFMGTT